MGRPEVAKSSMGGSPTGAKQRSGTDSKGLLALPGRGMRWLRWDRRETVLAIATLAIALFAIVAGLSLYGFSHGSRIYEGVHVAGVDLGGMTQAQARAALQEPLARSNTTPLTLSADGETYTIVPADSGLRFNLDATVDQAYEIGRSESTWKRVFVWSNALLHGRDVSPAYDVDDAVLNSVLTNLAAKVVIAPQDAYVSMSFASGPAIVPEANGRAVDLSATRAMLIGQFAQLTRDPVAIVMPILTPAVTSAQLEGGAASAQKAVAGSFTISGPESQAWGLYPADLANVISVSQHDGTMQVDQGAMERLVDGLASSIERNAQNASVYVDGNDQIVVQPGASSIEVDRKASLEAITEAMLQGGT